MGTKINKWYLLLAGAIIIIGGAIIFLFTYTFSVSGKVMDITNNQAIEGITLTVAGHSQKTDEQGDYKITGIKIYERKNLVVTPTKQYVKIADIQLNYSSRQVKKNLTAEPRLEEIVSRVLVGGKNGQYDYLWDLMAPDDRTYWGTKDEYKSLLTQRDKIWTAMNFGTKSYTLGKNIRKLDSWTSPITKKQYKDVMEVPVDTVLVDGGKETPKTSLDYYQKTEGFYHYFTQINKKDVQEGIDAYNKFQSEN
jgi:hypothetical protein